MEVSLRKRPFSVFVNKKGSSPLVFEVLEKGAKYPVG